MRKFSRHHISGIAIFYPYNALYLPQGKKFPKYFIMSETTTTTSIPETNETPPTITTPIGDVHPRVFRFVSAFVGTLALDVTAAPRYLAMFEENVTRSEIRRANAPTQKADEGNIFGLSSGVRFHTLDGVIPMAGDTFPVELPAGTIVEFSLNGMMMADDTPCAYGAMTQSRWMEAARSHPSIIGGFRRVMSGGGEVSAGVMYDRATRDFAASKPFISVETYSASAALMAGMNSTRVLLEGPSSSKGSVGVVIQLPRDFRDRYNASTVSVYSKEAPNKGGAIRHYLETGDLTMLEDDATESDKLFKSEVRKAFGIHKTSREGKTTLAGGMFSGDDAIERKLAHGYGGVKRAKEIILQQVRGGYRGKYKESAEEIPIEEIDLTEETGTVTETTTPQAEGIPADVLSQLSPALRQRYAK